MGKIQGASLADVSTEFNPIEPGLYELEIIECKEVKESAKSDKDGEEFEKIHYEVVSEVKGEIVDGSTQPSDHNGRKIRDFVYIHKNDGDLNQLGLVSLKRYAEATVGKERAEDEDFDTDELLRQRYAGEVYIDSYKPKNALPNAEPRKNNKVKNLVPLS